MDKKDFSLVEMLAQLFLLIWIAHNGAQAIPDCGSVVNNTLKSPGYPSYYPNSMDCNYSISIPNGMAMEINFHDFVVEDHRHCGYDYLIISNADGQTFGVYCGDRTGKKVLVTGRLVVIKFHSDSSAQRQGFLMGFTAVSLGNSTQSLPLKECGSVLNNSLKSPGYPDNYPNNTHCVYMVRIPQNMKINIYFSDFEVEEGPLCR